MKLVLVGILRAFLRWLVLVVGLAALFAVVWVSLEKPEAPGAVELDKAGQVLEKRVPVQRAR